MIKSNANNVGVFSTYTLLPSHFETDLELIQRELNQNSKVYVYHCQKKMQRCSMIVDFAKRRNTSYTEIAEKSCNSCVKKQNYGFNLLSGNIIKSPLIDDEFEHRNYDVDENEIESYKAIKELKIDKNFDVGWAILSALISMYRQPKINLPLFKEAIKKMYNDAAKIYFSALKYIDHHQLNKIYVFNGRLPITKAVMAAAAKKNIDCYVHERGSTFKKYSLFKNHKIHDIEKMTFFYESMWEEESNKSRKIEVGKLFFQERRQNIIGSWKSFLDQQKQDLLPSNFNRENHNLVFYCSSEDEFEGISEEWNNPLNANQLGILLKIADWIKSKNIHLYVRMHPNQSKMDAMYLSDFEQLKEFNVVTVINPDSEISSYALMDACDKVITYGSTTGVEALFYNKPSILVNKALHWNLKGMIKPNNWEELKDLILDIELSPVKENDALKWGFFMKMYGEEFKFYKPKDYKSGTYRGYNLSTLSDERNLWQKIIQKVLK